MPDLVEAAAVAQERVTAAEQALFDARVERDQAVAIAVANGTSMRSVGKRLGITHQAVQVAVKRAR